MVEGGEVREVVRVWCGREYVEAEVNGPKSAGSVRFRCREGCPDVCVEGGPYASCIVFEASWSADSILSGCKRGSMCGGGSGIGSSKPKSNREGPKDGIGGEDVLCCAASEGGSCI